MRIKLLKLIAGPMGTFSAGSELDFDAAFAVALIAAGAALPIPAEIETPEAAPEPETAAIKTRRRKK